MRCVVHKPHRTLLWNMMLGYADLVWKCSDYWCGCHFVSIGHGVCVCFRFTFFCCVFYDHAQHFWLFKQHHRMHYQLCNVNRLLIAVTRVDIVDFRRSFFTKQVHGYVNNPLTQSLAQIRLIEMHLNTLARRIQKWFWHSAQEIVNGL